MISLIWELSHVQYLTEKVIPSFSGVLSITYASVAPCSCDSEDNESLNVAELSLKIMLFILYVLF